MNILKIERIDKENVIFPKFRDEGDAGFDIHTYMPEGGLIIIHPKEIAKFRTGLKLQIPEGYYVELHLRSSAGIKKHLRLTNTIGIIDTNYRNEVLFFIENTGTEAQEILNGERLIQGIFRKKEKLELQEVEKVDETNRGAGFGSSGRI